MNKVEKVEALDRINVLSDPRQRQILKMLMARSRTISQLGRELGEYPAGVRYHIKKLEQAGFAEISEIRDSPGYIEKYYRANASAFLVQKIILPERKEKAIIFMGSHDLAFENLIAELTRKFPDLPIITLPIGSLDGLIALRQGLTDFTGCHLLDPDTGQYNSPFIKHFFPDKSISMITFANREQGLIIPSGNPKNVSGLEDIARQDITFVNRNRGSGTRIWLDNSLNKLGIMSGDINGYTKELCSHTGIAQLIKHNRADVGIGLIAAAIQEELDFIPLFDEQYDLVIPEEQLEDMTISVLMNYISSTKGHQSINALAGYATANTGDCLNV